MDISYVAFMNQVIRHIGLIIEYIGLAIVAGSVFISLWKVMQPKFTMEHVRHHLARRIIFGLEFVIAADILLATVTSTMEDLTQLAGIVIIRVILGYSLRKEASVK